MNTNKKKFGARDGKDAMKTEIIFQAIKLKAWHAAVALCALLLAGCAVLTVDVDVYKGPLANHPDVQLQQAASMAIAAQPLLEQLRDETEVLHLWRQTNNWKIPRSSDLSKLLQEWRDSHPNGVLRSSNLISFRARRVNEILSLYEDTREPVTNEVALGYIRRLHSWTTALEDQWKSVAHAKDEITRLRSGVRTGIRVDTPPPSYFESLDARLANPIDPGLNDGSTNLTEEQALTNLVRQIQGVTNAAAITKTSPHHKNGSTNITLRPELAGMITNLVRTLQTATNALGTNHSHPIGF